MNRNLVNESQQLDKISHLKLFQSNKNKYGNTKLAHGLSDMSEVEISQKRVWEGRRRLITYQAIWEERRTRYE